MKRILLLVIALSTLIFAQATTYILCEGNYGSTNSTLWSANSTFSEVSGPLHWDISSNPLGDTGQNLKIYHDKLFIVMNNSNTVEVADLSNGFEFVTSIDLPFAGPRDIEIVNNIAYVSCWYISGILCIDLSDYSIIDTLSLGKLPEDLLFYNDKLYSSITMNADWSSSNMVMEFDIADTVPVPADTFIVVTGPEEMVAHDNCIYVSSTYYDENWNIYAGNSKIDLSTGEVTRKDFGISFLFGRDITVFNNKIYRVYNKGICALTDSLTMDTGDQIGNYSSIYSMATHNDLIYFGLTNYIAPDTVAVLDSNGTQLAALRVGAIPGSFAFHESGNTTVINSDNLIPADFQLAQNYPNPFNGTTIIPYQIHDPGNINLSIFNALGQLVINLVEAHALPGAYSIKWNGQDQSGSAVSNGFYVAVLTHNGRQAAIKILYLK